MKLKISRNHSVNRMFNTMVLMVYLIAYFLLGLLPSVKYSVPYVIAGLFTLIPMFIVSIENPRNCKLFVFLVVAGIVQGTIAFLTGNAAITEMINEPIRSVRYFIPCILLTWTVNMSHKNQKLIWGVVTAILIAVAINTLAAVETNPMIARILANGSRDSELMEYRMQNIGGFEFCYAVCLLFSMCVYIAMQANGRVKFVSIVAVLFIAYFTIQVQYMTMLLLCIAAFIFVVMYCAKNTASKIIAVTFSAFLLLVVPPLLRWIAEFDVGTEIYTKLIKVAGVLDGTRELSETTSRALLYRNALIDFLWSPIWGMPNSVAAAESHSTFLGIASSTGLIGVIAYTYGIVQCYNQTKRNLLTNKCGTGIFSVSYIIFLILAIINPIHYAYEISIILFFYVPLTVALFLNRN